MSRVLFWVDFVTYAARDVMWLIGRRHLYALRKTWVEDAWLKACDDYVLREDAKGGGWS